MCDSIGVSRRRKLGIRIVQIYNKRQTIFPEMNRKGGQRRYGIAEKEGWKKQDPSLVEGERISVFCRNYHLPRNL